MFVSLFVVLVLVHIRSCAKFDSFLSDSMTDSPKLIDFLRIRDTSGDLQLFLRRAQVISKVTYRSELDNLKEKTMKIIYACSLDLCSHQLVLGC